MGGRNTLISRLCWGPSTSPFVGRVVGHQPPDQLLRRSLSLRRSSPLRRSRNIENGNRFLIPRLLLRRSSPERRPLPVRRSGPCPSPIDCSGISRDPHSVVPSQHSFFDRDCPDSRHLRDATSPGEHQDTAIMPTVAVCFDVRWQPSLKDARQRTWSSFRREADPRPPKIPKDGDL